MGKECKVGMINSIDIKTIYEHMSDSESRKIFGNRLLYSLTGNRSYIKNVIQMTKEGKEFCEKITGVQPKVIFGAGIWGKEILDTYKDIKFECFVDNKVKRQAENYCELPVISFEQYLHKYNKAVVVIATRLYYRDIYCQLKEYGISDENIVNAGKMIDDMSKRQYFDLPELKGKSKGQKESFIDAGSFDGRTSVLFAEWCQNNYSHIWAFEPDERNIEKCKKTLECLEGIKAVISKGLWNEKTELSFANESNGGSKILESGERKVCVDKLDSMIQDKVTFIKMDIEGSEFRALKGSEEIIKRDRPKLAISIYHKAEDIWELPLLILKINPEYRLYLRHYSTAAAETVLYAV